MSEEIVDTGSKNISDKTGNKTVVRVTEDTYVEKIRFEGENASTPIEVLRPKDKGVR